MNSLTATIRRLLILAFTILPSAQQSLAQQQPRPDEILRTNTELVQTSITVIDKDGHFVDGLTREQFELLVDGKPRPINFFERVSAGSLREDELTLRAEASTGGYRPSTANLTLRGRSIVFFIDDMHMSADSMHRTRDMLRHFVDAEMSSLDLIAIASASGQLGFLQQFTNNKEILSTAIDRLSPRQYEVRSYGTGSTKMREFDALIIDNLPNNRPNNEVLNYYIRECVVQSNPPKQVQSTRALIAASCETEVRNSARAVLIQSAGITLNMYASLETLMRSLRLAPGRKLAFFISDGFLLDDGPHAPDLRGKLDSVIDSAQRSGVVVYTIDSRGLVNDKIDLSQGNARMDFGAPVGELESHQDAMNALAGDTGGRALRNQNYFDRWVDRVLAETSNYYLIAWRPDKPEEIMPRFRNVKVAITGRPELTIRVPRGYLDTASNTNGKAADNHTVKTAEADLREALGDFYPRAELPIMLSLTYLNTPKNDMVLNTSAQLASRSLSYGEDGKQPANIKVAGVILTDKGKIASSFKTQLNIDPINSGHADASGIIYNQHTPLPSGMYQVRLAARDERTGRVGSARQWVVIPDLGTRQLTLSSVLLGGQVLENGASNDPQVQLSVDHRFRRSSSLGFWIFVYNARRDAAGKPNLTMSTEVLRNTRVVLAARSRQITTGLPDPDRIPFGDQLLLGNLEPGRYDLRVTVTDIVAGTSFSQTIDFEVL